MKVVISATGRDLDATVDERFGRCRYFLIVETDDMSVEAVDNVNADLSTSAGIQSASYVASTGAEALITGNCGPKAMQVFAETNIRIILGQKGTIKDVLKKFKDGTLSPSTRENVPEKSGALQSASNRSFSQPGMGGGGGRGMGGGGRCMGGGGRGMGGGGGRCMGGGGRGMGMGGGGMGRQYQPPGASGSTEVPDRAANVSRGQELDRLQRQADELKKQMDAIQAKIKDLA
jgi:predicted Fe-Mo cluster-binding NifX family protein